MSTTTTTTTTQEEEEYETSEIKLEEEPIKEKPKKKGVNDQELEEGTIKLNTSSLESFYIFNQISIGYYAGDMQNTYLRFDDDNNKLVDVIYDVKKGGVKELNPVYDPDKCWLIDPKMATTLYNEMAKNRANGKGTALDMIGTLDDRKIAKVSCTAFKSLNL